MVNIKKSINDRDSQIKKVVHHYSLLFTLPKHKYLLFSIFLLNIVGNAVSFTILSMSMSGLLYGSIFGLLVMTLPFIFLDYILKRFLFANDLIFSSKRISALTLFNFIVWTILIIFGAFLQLVLKDRIIYETIFIYIACLITAFRFLIFKTLVYWPMWKIIITSAEPLLSVLLTLFLWDKLGYSILLKILFSLIILFFAVILFINIIDRNGKKKLGINTTSLFKGFLSNWLGGIVEPLEEFFDKIGTDINIPVSILSFITNRYQKAMLVVPGFHPGPFKNVGSSNLGFEIQKSFEEKFKVATIVVHSPGGHESDVTSRNQCNKVIEETLNFAEHFPEYYPNATKFSRIETNYSKVSCQVFNKLALITITCSPKNMEDIPSEVGLEITKKGLTLGFKKVVVIDAHNSIGEPDEALFFSEEDKKNLITISEKIMKIVLNEKFENFKIGTARIIPTEFGVSQGMGPGGIFALIVMVNEQKVVYLIIDGNNMIRGLREKIMDSIKNLVDDGEILTTDTHLVSAINTVRRGYYPIGEAIDIELLISYIKKVVVSALENLKEAEISYKTEEISKVRVLGTDMMFEIVKFINSIIKKIKIYMVIILFPLIIISFLLFLF